ncbi:MAG: divalent-cation tolerance protein CutA [Desulfobacterales bacterium]|nr:divalent-cation tolerance protein CutA [Desulfobacterales bacterium]
MTGYIQVMTTVESKEDGTRIAGRLVEQKLAACVQIIGPMTSIYRWQGAVQEAEEFLCIAKTRQGSFEAVREAIGAIHPYEVPEIVAVEITAGSASYLQWLDQEIVKETS